MTTIQAIKKDEPIVILTEVDTENYGILNSDELPRVLKTGNEILASGNNL
jgi:hypothetical protein